MMLFALIFLWLGAVSLGALVLVRGRWQHNALNDLPVPSLNTRRLLEAVCLFVGTGGMVLGVGLLGLSLTG